MTTYTLKTTVPMKCKDMSNLKRNQIILWQENKISANRARFPVTVRIKKSSLYKNTMYLMRDKMPTPREVAIITNKANAMV